jgi:hypothetical protein
MHIDAAEYIKKRKDVFFALRKQANHMTVALVDEQQSCFICRFGLLLVLLFIKQGPYGTGKKLFHSSAKSCLKKLKAIYTYAWPLVSQKPFVFKKNNKRT